MNTTNQFIIIAKKTYQTSEDTWERATISFIANDQTTVADIMLWIKDKQGDENTIKIIPNTI